MYIDNWQTQLRKGMLDIVVLNLLSHGPCHGYELVQRMKTIEGLKIREGNVYPILARLQEEKLVENYTEPSADGPPRKYFKVTTAGQQTLADMNGHWEQIIQSIRIIQKGEI
ncbi:MAG: PadR family transcriptional regulator [Planctomycetota bacterium]|jgi:PadR family transcriptional regulator PadR